MPHKRKKPEAEAVRAVAERIAKELFTNYDGTLVDFLVLTSMVRGDMGSWSQWALADVVEKHLKRSRLTRQKGKGKR